VARVTGQRASSTLPGCDTPRDAGTFPAHGDPADSAQSARSAWRSVTPSIAGTPHVRISHDGGRTYPARYARPLPAEPPSSPATVPVYDAGTGSGRMLVLDLDPGRGRGGVHGGGVHHHRQCGAAEVAAQAAAVTELVARYGGQVLADLSPSGGRHVFIPFAAPLPWRELRDLCRAVALRFPVVDPAPMANLGGQISPPGSRHKSGGWRTLAGPLEDARAVVEQPNGPEVWAGLLDEFAAELRLAEPVESAGDVPAGAELDDVGVPWVPRLGGRAPLGAGLEQTARTGRWDRSRYAGRSEARMAVLGAAAARGWQLADVQAAIGSGAWRGLAGLYERRSEPGRLARLLPAEWRKTIGFVAGEKNVRHRPTSDLSPRPPAGGGAAAEYGLIRQWLTAVDCAVQDPGRVKGWGGRSIAVRLVLAALGQAAMVSGCSVIEFGTRNLALHAAVSHRTVARVLQLLRDEPDPLVDLVSEHSLGRADRYQLRIPQAYADSVRWRRRRAGRVEAVHPVFLRLGGTTALAYQALGQLEVRGAEVARAAAVSSSAASAALRVLAEHGLANRGPGGWRRGAVGLDDVAESTGAAEIHRERAERYKQDREDWQGTLRKYQGRKALPVTASDGWLSLDDEDEWAAMLLSRWPVLRDDVVRGPPKARASESA